MLTCEPSSPRLFAWRALALCLVALATVACTRDQPSLSSAGDDSIDEVPPPAPTLSHFDVPLEYELTPILREVERVVPRTLGSLDRLHQVGDDGRRHYAFEVTRGPFTAFMRGSEVHLRTTLSYAVRGFYNPPVGPTLSAGCGRGGERPEMVVEFVTPLTLTPTWHLRSQVRLAQMRAASASAQDRCRVSLLRFDVTDRVIEAARAGLTAHLPEIDREIARIDLSERVTEWWWELNRPIRLSDGVWLLLQPQQLRAGQITGQHQTLRMRVGLAALPRIVTGPEPAPPVPPIPRLASSTHPTGFRIVLDGDVDYATASQAITQAVRGRTVTTAGRSVTVQSVVAAPAGAGRLALSVIFVGDASGTLRLVGTPHYDAELGQIRVPDLDYDLETDSHLVNAIAWIRSDALRTLFRENAQVPVAPVLERGKAWLIEGLNRTIGHSASMSATVDSVTVDGLYVTRAGLVVRAGASGKAQVSVREPL